MASERVCPGCGTDLRGTHGRRKWCSEKCRRETSYGGTCEDCGAPTNGNDGPGTAAKRCAECAPRANRIWSRERIVAKIQEWSRRYGAPPTSRDWLPAMAAWQGSSEAAQIKARFEDGEWPSTNTVIFYFSRWNNAIAAAGFDPRPAHGPRASGATV